jgi:hypothetical protein
MKKIVGLFLISVSLFGFGHLDAKAAFEGQFLLEPKTLDLELEQGEVVEKKVTIENKSQYLLELYASIAEYDQVIPKQNNGKQNSFGSWISVFRGLIRLAPGEKQELPIRIDVDGQAAPGNYYAYLSFSSNPILAGQYSTLLHANVYTKIVEKAELQEFRPARNIFLDNPFTFNFKIKNLGNKTIYPNGNLRIYNRRGEEVKVMQISNYAIESDAVQDYSSSWEDSGVWGRYKARLVMEYGQDNGRDIQDVVFFWVLPYRLLAVYSVLLIVLILLMIVFNIRQNRRKSRKKELKQV